MKIVLVIDQFDDSNNGTTVTARRFARAQLRRRGHEVVILAGGRAVRGQDMRSGAPYPGVPEAHRKPGHVLCEAR